LTRLLARFAKNCNGTTSSLATLQHKHRQEKYIIRQTHRQRVVDGHDAGPQGLHILIVSEDVILPKGAVPVNLPPW
jgi:hypothetical protein